MNCPKCGSTNCNFISSTHTKRGSFCDACCGFALLGPIGILCGFCDSGSSTKEYWVCNNCGSKFNQGSYSAPSTISQSVQNTNQVQINSKSQLPLQNQPIMSDPDTAVLNTVFAAVPFSTTKNTNGENINESSDTISIGNIFNKGLAATYKNNLYFVKSSKENKEYIVRIIEGVRSELHIDYAEYLFADQNGLYFLVYSNMKKLFNVYNIHYWHNNSASSVVISTTNVKRMYVDHTHIYYINADDGDSIYRMNKDGSNIQKIVWDKCSNLAIYEDKLYYINKTNSRKLYSLTKDLTLMECPVKVTNIDSFCIANGVIFYRRNTIADIYKVFIYNLTTKTGGLLIEFGISSANMNVCQGNIFLCNKGIILRYSIKDNTIVGYNMGNVKVKQINIIGDYIYYGDFSQILGRVKINGRDDERL